MDAAAALGLGAGTPLYYDLELYAENDASCSAGVRAFVDAWSERVRARGYLAGVYGNARNAQADWRTGVIANPPDAVWLVPWVCNRGTTSCNWEPTVFGIPGLNDAYWANNQRIRQYWGDHNETYGGVTFNIDSDYANGPVAGAGTSSSCQTAVPADHWKGEYFNNMTLSGSPVMVRDDGTGSLDFDWGSGSPASSCGVPADHFSVRWTRSAFFNAGIYDFTITSDDGFRLYVDGVLQMQAWIDQGPTTYTKKVSLTAGNHTIKVEYYENGGGAVAKVSWKLASNCFTTVPSTSWKGEYFLNKNLNGSPAMIRNDGTGFLNFEWYSNSHSSACAFPADNFSVRWTRSVYFSAGTYRFNVTSDDGFRLYVDGVIKLQAWFDQGPTSYSVNVPLSAGYHTIKMEYYENGGWAVAKLSWTAAPVQAVLRQVVWRGGVGYVRIVPFLPDASRPDWGTASAWSAHSASSLPGWGTVQTWDTYAMQSGLLESFWRGHQGYYRIVPWGSNGHPHCGAAPGWNGPIAISALPGSGSIQAQDSFRPGNVMWQSFWRGNQGWFRTVPVNSEGAPIWSQAGGWNGPLGLAGLPGTGSIQSQSGEIYPGNNTLLQSIWRNNLGYYRTVPIDSAGNLLWSQAQPWSAPLSISGLPGSGNIHAQAGAVYNIAD